MIKKSFYLMILFVNFVSLNLSASDSTAIYNNKNKSVPKMFLSEQDKKRYETNGDRNLQVYEEGDTINGIPLAKEPITDITDDNVVPCHDGEINLSTKLEKTVNGNTLTIRKMHEIYGIPENGKSTGTSAATSSYGGKKIGLDSTSLPEYGTIISNLVSKREENTKTGRYCTAKKLNDTNTYEKENDEGQYDTPREYCKAGELSEVFYSSFEDPYGKKPSCRLTLDTDIRIDDIRFLRQAIAPDSFINNGDYDNYSIGNGIVKCTLLNGTPTLTMIENPPESLSCTPTTYATAPCCNPLTGFGCEAQFCQYGANKHCKGQELPSQGSCNFKNDITLAVKDVVTLTDGSGVGKFKCLENGNWQTINISGC
jgi:hypothetical protein